MDVHKRAASQHWFTQKITHLLFWSPWLFLLLLSPALAQQAPTQSVRLAWDRSEGTNVAGYRIYYGIQRLRYDLIKDAGTNLTAAIESLQSGTTYYFAAAAYSSEGVQSDFSTDISYRTPGESPTNNPSNPTNNPPVVTNLPPANVVSTTLFLEAESGQITPPMAASTDMNASGTKAIYSPSDNRGSAAYNLQIPKRDEYFLWCRVLSRNSGADSFFVSVDGGAEDIYDTVPNTWSSSWQWTRLNGRAQGGLRRLLLTQGQHTITFRSREPYTSLDAIYVTSDPAFVPVKLALSYVRGPEEGMELSFQSPEGYRYQILATENLTNWVSIWQSPVAQANERFVYLDTTVTAWGRRWYRLAIEYTKSAAVPLKLEMTRVRQPVPSLDLSFQTAVGAQYEIQSTENMVDWTTLSQTTVATTNKRVGYRDPIRTNAPARFYRVVAQ